MRMEVPGLFLGCSGWVGKFREYGSQLIEYRKNNRRYGRQLREYVVNMREMCQCHGACFWMWVGDFLGTGHNQENIS